MKKIVIKASRTYEVQVEKNLLASAGASLAALLPPPRTVMVVSDDTVFALWGEKLTASLRAAGYTVKEFVIPHGEKSKTPETLFALWNALAAEGLTRSDLLAALGGGVVGDIVGFAAATYLRGIPFVQFPTTLLAMVDSSVGGKTAVDLPAGKNLVGAFNQPIGVFCDTDTLSTLPPEIYADGCAEVIKYGYINDPALLEMLEKDFSGDPEEVIARCVCDKRDVVEADERDTGVRQLLNLGHTAGHAVEHCSNFTLSHGSSVAIGMVVMTRAAIAAGLCDPAVLPHMLQMLERYHLPVTCPFTASELAAVAMGDKKRNGKKITLVLPRTKGESILYPIDAKDLEAFFAKGLEA
ncbi:MAG: 3-dehydroquinate synthase [Ruminococcaceae bacterium]|nr:3-dehydroquinate synthase [Oscillospiraceae bacterium]